MTADEMPDSVGEMAAALAARMKSEGMRPGGIVPEPSPLRTATEDLAELRQALTTERWTAMAPRRFQHAALALLDPQQREPVEDWVQEGAVSNLLLLGPVGTGKTFAALAGVRELVLAELRTARFLPVVELLDMLRPGGPDGAMAELTGVDLLVLDDLGHERPTDWTAERLGALVNRRWLEQRPIVATSNLEPPELRTALGERTFSRLAGDAAVVRLTGDDRRRKGSR